MVELLTNYIHLQAVPDQQGLHLFSIDPRDQSSVETANLLWTMMEGHA